MIVCVMAEVAGLTLQDLYSIPMTPQDLPVAQVEEVLRWYVIKTDDQIYNWDQNLFG